MRELLDTLLIAHVSEQQFWAVYKKILPMLKDLRLQNSIPQKAIAARAHVTQYEVSIFERGASTILGREKLIRLLSVYTQLEEGTYDNELERSA